MSGHINIQSDLSGPSGVYVAKPIGTHRAAVPLICTTSDLSSNVSFAAGIDNNGNSYAAQSCPTPQIQESRIKCYNNSNPVYTCIYPQCTNTDLSSTVVFAAGTDSKGIAYNAQSCPSPQIQGSQQCDRNGNPVYTCIYPECTDTDLAGNISYTSSAGTKTCYLNTQPDTQLCQKTSTVGATQLITPVFSCIIPPPLNTCSDAQKIGAPDNNGFFTVSHDASYNYSGFSCPIGKSRGPAVCNYIDNTIDGTTSTTIAYSCI